MNILHKPTGRIYKESELGEILKERIPGFHPELIDANGVYLKYIFGGWKIDRYLSQS